LIHGRQQDSAECVDQSALAVVNLPPCLPIVLPRELLRRHKLSGRVPKAARRVMIICGTHLVPSAQFGYRHGNGPQEDLLVSLLLLYRGVHLCTVFLNSSASRSQEREVRAPNGLGAARWGLSG